MKRLCLIGCLMACAVVVMADRYVVMPGTAGVTSGVPYNTWTNAATNISTAVSAATNGETVWVTNGAYVSTGAMAGASMVYIDKGITLRSVNGRTNTFIDANYPAVSNRCFTINHTSAVVIGFTVSNGYTVGSVDGGGAYFNAGRMQDCLVINNVSARYGGGVLIGGTGTLLQDCSIISNRASSYGGGVMSQGAAIVSNCFIEWNSTLLQGGGVYCNAAGLLVQACWIGGNSAIQNGGGIRIGASLTVNDCTITNNIANLGGGVYSEIAINSLLRNCTIVGNTGTSLVYSGGGVYFAAAGWATASCCKIIGNVAYGDGGGVYCSGQTNRFSSCLIALNSAAGNGGGVRMSSVGGDFWNCTVVSNSSSSAGLYAQAGTLRNTIVCSNSPANVAGTTTNTWFYNCALPSTNGLQGSNNIAGDPLFVDFSQDNYRLARESPCVNTGLNAEWMSDAFDLDGRDRLDKFGRIVDIGCYEYLFSGTIFTIK